MAELHLMFSSGLISEVINADRMMIEESIFCLLSNALDAIEDRQDAAGPTNQKDKIEVIIRRAEGGEVEISVHDTGIGFDSAASEKLFLPFYTTKSDRPLDETSSRHQGIGLFTVRRVMRLHGGEVTAESPGYHQGATFTLRFPNRV